MTRNPYLNALTAAVYIAAISSFLFYIPNIFAGQNDTVLAPIMMLSLLVLSALVMGTCFLYQPLQMYLDGHKREATSLFIKTVVAFAGITILLLFTLILLSRYLPQKTEMLVNNSETVSSGQEITLTGIWECLPHKGDGPHTLECAFGVAKDQSDGHYAIDTHLMTKYPVDFPTGAHVRITGTLTPANQLKSVSPYDIDGIIRATTMEQI